MQNVIPLQQIKTTDSKTYTIITLHGLRITIKQEIKYQHDNHNRITNRSEKKNRKQNKTVYNDPT